MTREKAILAIEMAQALLEWDYPMDYAVAFEMAINTLKEPERVHAHWIKKALRPTCSSCGFCGSILDAPVAPFKYCPNCGAIMDEEE